jgi:hypothetical protein
MPGNFQVHVSRITLIPIALKSIEKGYKHQSIIKIFPFIQKCNIFASKEIRVILETCSWKFPDISYFSDLRQITYARKIQY